MIDDININAEQVKAGMASAYRYHGRASDETILHLEYTLKKKPDGMSSSATSAISRARHFKIVRYYGFLANRKRGSLLPKVYEVLSMTRRRNNGGIR